MRWAAFLLGSCPKLLLLTHKVELGSKESSSHLSKTQPEPQKYYTSREKPLISASFMSCDGNSTLLGITTDGFVPLHFQNTKPKGKMRCLRQIQVISKTGNYSKEQSMSHKQKGSVHHYFLTANRESVWGHHLCMATAAWTRGAFINLTEFGQNSTPGLGFSLTGFEVQSSWAKRCHTHLKLTR